jgi:hypothetical protein
VVWAVLGTGASLAWFSDTSPEINNIFHFADFEVAVSHQLTDGTWEDIDGKTDIFNDEALYEPGYVQVIYLKVKNKGSVPFNFYTAVSIKDSKPSKNVFGDWLWLHEHLKFGVVSANSEAEMESKVATREMARNIATMRLQNYDKLGAAEILGGQEIFMALVVTMHELVGNEANYGKGEDIPEVRLGVIFKAEQQQ